MANLNVAILGSLDYGKELGKKGTASDLTFYNLKKGQNTVTFIEPTRYPEKLAPLFYAVSMAQKALLIVEQINPAFGESVIMLDSVGVKEGIVVLKNYLSREQIAPFIKGTVVDGYEFLEDDKNVLRERLLEDVGQDEFAARCSRLDPYRWIISSMCAASARSSWGLWPKGASRSTTFSGSCRERRLPRCAPSKSMMRTSIQQA